MFYFLCAVMIIISPVFSYSQENQQQNKNPYDVNFTFKTDQQPFYPEGDISLFTYFYNNINYNENAVADKISGEVMVSFYVMPDSTLAEINVLSGVGYGIDEEVARVLKPLKYAPGIIDGEKVKMNVILYVPVRTK
ncbi:MAG: energy transducer TonB [Bacteroidota bacterium]